MGKLIALPTERAKDRPLRAVLYLRVSTAEQAATDYDEDGYSLHAQRDACRRAAERLNADVVDEYVDRGKSARSADRPQLQAMLRRVRDQRDIDYVVVHKVDRLARSRADDVQIVLALRKAGASLVSATENIDETPSGTLLHAIMAAVAEFYSGNLALEAKKGMHKKAEFGGTPGNSPVGYRNTRDRVDGKDIGIVVLDEPRAAHIRWAFKTYALGQHTLKQLAEELGDRGFTLPATVRLPERPASVQIVHKILHNRYYLGRVTWGGVEYAGRHEAVIDQATFDAVQALLASRNMAGDKPQQRPHPLKGSIYCGRCGRRFGIVYANGRGGQYPYFYCLGRQKDANNCQQGHVAVDRVEDAVAKHWQTFQLTEVRRQELRTAVLDLFHTQTAGAEAEIASQQARILAVKHQQQKAKEAYYNDAMDIAEFKDEQQRHTRELVSAEAIIQQHLTSLEGFERGLDELLQLTTDPVAFYEAAPDGIKRMLLQEVFEKIWIIDDQIVGVDLTRPFAELLTVEARLDARNALTGTDKAMITYERREPVMRLESRRYLRRERPMGPLSADLSKTSNALVDEADMGSNFTTLVVLTGPRSRSHGFYEHLLNLPKRHAPVKPISHLQHQHRLTPAEVVALVQAYQSGADMKQLAIKFGVHRTTVAGWLRRLGIPLRRQGIQDNDIPAAIRLYQQGWSLVRLGEHFACDAETVRQAFKQANIARRGAHGR
jgi:DNA invertase Pin-like site-specific DNA recombinase